MILCFIIDIYYLTYRVIDIYHVTLVISINLTLMINAYINYYIVFHCAPLLIIGGGKLSEASVLSSSGRPVCEL